MLRHMLRLPILVVLVAVAMASIQARQPSRIQDGLPYPPRMQGASEQVYKVVGDVKLNLYIFSPLGHKPGDAASAIVFFFGGGWRSGSPKQFEQQCRYLASRGMVAMAADYRVASRHNARIVDCVRDAKSAIRWVRRNAARLGIDPNRVAAGGGSAGGHLAAATATIEKFDEPDEDTSTSSKPNALALFNPAVVLAPMQGIDLGRAVDLRQRAGVEPMELSPYHHVKAGAPPAIIFHGKADTTVPYATVEMFTKAMKQAGNRCDLNGYEGEVHGFFNFGRGGNKSFLDTVKKMDCFFASLGYLTGEPSVDSFDWKNR